MLIVGGDPVIGRSLEVLLQAAGYRTLFQPEPPGDELGKSLIDSHLLIVAPGLSAERRKAIMDIMASPATVKIPVLELLSADGVEQDIQGERVVLWPCSMEELKRAVHAALLAHG
jgi:hypothetical protein